MEAGAQSGIPAQSTRNAADAGSLRRRATKRLPLRSRDVQLYRLCEDLTEAVIYAMVVFGPWAFGTTQSWSIWLMNGAGYLLGLLLACKLTIRRLKDYQPPRWDDGQGESQTTDHRTTGPQDGQSPVVSGQWSVVSDQSSVVSGQWSVVSSQ